MCPLRLILIFLSATVAGFFVLRGLKAKPQDDDCDALTESPSSSSSSAAAGEPPSSQDCPSLSCSAKVGSAIRTGFWTCVDMASGRYLWRNLVSSPPPATAAAANDKRLTGGIDHRFRTGSL